MQWILQDIPLGRNIQTVRMSKNMTQIEVVEQLQLMGSMMSRSTLANIEAGRRNIKASDLKALQVLFDVEYSEFFKDWENACSHFYIGDGNYVVLAPCKR